MGTSDPANETFLALLTDAFRPLLEEPEAREHVAGFASGDRAVMVTRDRAGGAEDGARPWRRAEHAHTFLVPTSPERPGEAAQAATEAPGGT